MFYMLTQNNSFGEFRVNDKLCHHMVIEADSEVEALSIAEELGCYWNGVSNGIDCPCCGDRWSRHTDEIDIGKLYRRGGYSVTVYSSGGADSALRYWHKMYDEYAVAKSPVATESWLSHEYKATGKVNFKNVEEYVQFLANEYPGTKPDARIFYKDGTVKEFKCEKSLRN